MQATSSSSCRTPHNLFEFMLLWHSWRRLPLSTFAGILSSMACLFGKHLAVIRLGALCGRQTRYISIRMRKMAPLYVQFPVLRKHRTLRESLSTEAFLDVIAVMAATLPIIDGANTVRMKILRRQDCKSRKVNAPWMGYTSYWGRQYFLAHVDVLMQQTDEHGKLGLLSFFTVPISG